MDKRAGYVIAWVVCAVVAIAIGLLAVSTVGASVSDRGPLGDGDVRDPSSNEAGPDTEASPLPGAETVRATIRREFGELDVECRGAVAYATDARPDTAAGWDVVSFEPGPDDDVDAVFSNRGRSIEFEVFCNRGEPTLADYEENTLPEDDD
ncbi:hypothetical protein [Nocardioides sp. CFH 31398]|uniref:hypothetical protein n=1 Tax=Nocardioides sp. CFH 31398 TaxID=2919579 RepID=UPI001F0661B8|nr:hypothetical protein [Nocardioides sp. CFH 31398]MCH1868496.1 hypothetical protein [Nocardioides sp. CFH 31398]